MKPVRFVAASGPGQGLGKLLLAGLLLCVAVLTAPPSAAATTFSEGFSSLSDTLPDDSYDLCKRDSGADCSRKVDVGAETCKANGVYNSKHRAYIWGCTGFNYSNKVYGNTFTGLLRSHQYITLSNSSINDEVIDYGGTGGTPTIYCPPGTRRYCYAHTAELTIYSRTKDVVPINMVVVDRGIGKKYACNNTLTGIFYRGDEKSSKPLKRDSEVRYNQKKTPDCGAAFTLGYFPAEFLTEVPGTSGSSLLYKGRIVMFYGDKGGGDGGNIPGSQASFHIWTPSNGAKLSYTSGDSSQNSPLWPVSTDYGAEHGWTNTYPTNLSYRNKVTYRFMPQCDTNPKQSFFIQWDDGNDNNALLQPDDATVTLYRFKPDEGYAGKTPIGSWHLGSNSLPRFTGKDGKELMFSQYAPGKPYAYIVEIENVNGGNGISFRYPADSAVYPCPGSNPPTGTLGFSCSNGVSAFYSIRDPDAPDGTPLNFVIRSGTGSGGNAVASGSLGSNQSGGRQYLGLADGTYSLWVDDYLPGGARGDPPVPVKVDTSPVNCRVPTAKGRCYRATIADDGTAANGKPSRTLVFINSNPLVTASVGRTRDLDGDGKSGFKDDPWDPGNVTNERSGSWNYFPARDPQNNTGLPSPRGTVRVKLLFQEWRQHIQPGHWEGAGKSRKWVPEKRWYQWDTVAESDNQPNCFTAVCSVQVVGDTRWGGRPRPEAVRSGETFTVRARMTNTLPNSGPTRPPNLWENLSDFRWENVFGPGVGSAPIGPRLGITSSQPDASGNREHPLGYGLYGSGTTSADVTMTFRATGGAGRASYSLYPDYYGWTGIGPPCSFTVDVFENFNVTNARETATLNDYENPSRFDYSTYLCANASVPVYIPTNSRAYYTLYRDGVQRTLDSNSGGTYRGCGTIWSGSRGVSAVSAGDRYCTYLRADYTGGWVGPRGPNDLADTRGGYETSPERCATVHDEPYLHIFGSDVSAGGGFGSTNCNAAGGINAYLSQTGNSGQRPRGSGVQIGALSIGPITGFSSAQIRNSAPFASTGLSFSNTIAASGSGAGSPALGGRLGTSHCVADYFSALPASAARSTATNASIDGSSTNLKYYEPAGGTLTIDNPTTIANGTHTAIYVKGNVVIKGDIKYDGNTNWGTLENLPSFQIVAYGGNIYIDPSVRQLDGLYVAQPNVIRSGGSLYTCANGTNQLNGSGYYNTCKQQLVVNGAFVANRAFLDRSFSSRRHSYAGERPGSASRVCSNDGVLMTAFDDCASEIFNFGLEMFLMRPPVNPSSGPTTGRFDYITSLAPVL